MSVFIQEFSDAESIISQYAAPVDALAGATIHLAWYGYGDYCGSSLVIFEKDGKLYEVNASHCSCYGLEGQWEPEETNWEALAMRGVDGECEGSAEANVALQKIVSEHLPKKEEVVS
jgi:hypothetical protein